MASAALAAGGKVTFRARQGAVRSEKAGVRVIHQQASRSLRTGDASAIEGARGAVAERRHHVLSIARARASRCRSGLSFENAPNKEGGYAS